MDDYSRKGWSQQLWLVAPLTVMVLIIAACSSSDDPLSEEQTSLHLLPGPWPGSGALNKTPIWRGSPAHNRQCGRPLAPTRSRGSPFRSDPPTRTSTCASRRSSRAIGS